MTDEPLYGQTMAIYFFVVKC